MVNQPDDSTVFVRDCSEGDEIAALEAVVSIQKRLLPLLIPPLITGEMTNIILHAIDVARQNEKLK